MPIVRIFYDILLVNESEYTAIPQGNEQQSTSKHFRTKPLTTNHVGRFPSGWGWFCFFQPPPPLGVYKQQKSSQVNSLPKAKSKTRSKQNKDMHKFSSVYSERGVPLTV
jgi:hypothetical protein